jgi:glycosyltransferase involved in cell wall biosynthesis
MGAKVVQRAFDNFGNQRNFALDEIDFKHDWVFHLDADERFNDELKAECERVIALDEKSGYFVPNRIMFIGRWIKHCTRYPYPQVRLIKRGEIRFEASGHGQREADAKRGVGHIQVPYDHYNFSKGLEDWFAKHNRYSSEEARLALELERQPILECLNRDAMIRKRALKSWFVRMPFRPQIKFLFLYVVCRGFLDGKPGWIYCRMQAIYEAMIEVKKSGKLKEESGK